MSRMLDALKQIQAKSPQMGPAIEPVSAEELQAFGLRPSAEPESPAPPQPAEAVQAAPAAPRADPLDAAESGGLVHPVEARSPKPGRDLGRPSPLLTEGQKDQYQRLAGKVLEQWTPGRPAALMFTSAGDGEGKTTTMAALATVLAESVAEEIVAVDANFRSPTLANHFGIWADQGLFEALRSGADWQRLVRKTSVAGLSVLPGGKLSTQDGCPLDPASLGEVLDTLRRRYPLVLVDTPSLAHPEVAPLAKLCDGTYLIVRIGQTGRQAARHALRLIERHGGRVLGCVLTSVPIAC